MFRDLAREFVRRELTPEVIKEHERQHRFPHEVIMKMASPGLTGDIVPQEYEGVGVDWVSHGLISEEIGGAWFSLCLSVQLVQTGLVEYPILKFGNEEQLLEEEPTHIIEAKCDHCEYNEFVGYVRE
jgi:alkylation response protein AidB-like acyl-CoA dehydrogenase